MTWLERVARRHLAPLRDVTDDATRAAVRRGLDTHAQTLADLEQEVLSLTEAVAAEHEAEALREWQDRRQ